MTRADLAPAARPLCARCGFLPATHGTLCCHCSTLTTLVRELLAAGLTRRDAAERLGVHERVVVDVERRLRA